MSIREQTMLAAPRPNLKHRLVRVIVTDDLQLFAVWVIELPNGKRAERSVQVTDAVATQITGRASFQTLLDAIQTDTYPRTGA